MSGKLTVIVTVQLQYCYCRMLFLFFFEYLYIYISGKYFPYTKEGNTPLYAHRKSSHPPSILKSIPDSINIRLRNFIRRNPFTKKHSTKVAITTTCVIINLMITIYLTVVIDHVILFGVTHHTVIMCRLISANGSLN